MNYITIKKVFLAKLYVIMCILALLKIPLHIKFIY